MNMVNFDNGVCALTDKGLVRPHNEDSNRVERTKNGDLFVVCDGMGGHVGGATASQMGVDYICHYANEFDNLLPQQFLVKALEYANRQIYSASCANTELKGMGTTACVVLVRNDKVWYAHVGDSRIYYFNAKGKALYRLTKDHSVVQSMVDQGLITEAEAEHHPEKNKIRKSLGVKPEVEPEPCQMPLIPAEGDMVLICSDGLSGMMDDDDILEVLLTADNVNAAGKVLMELAKSGGGTDNITLQLVRFSGVGEREAVFDAKNKGVFLKKEKNDIKQRKPLWPWIVIVASLLMLLLALVLLNKPQPKENENEISSEIVVEDAYLKMIPHGVQPTATYNHKEHDYAYYHFNDRSVLVDLTTKEFWIGDFDSQPINNGEDKKYDLYIPNPNNSIHYNRNGEVIPKIRIK